MFISNKNISETLVSEKKLFYNEINKLQKDIYDDVYKLQNDVYEDVHRLHKDVYGIKGDLQTYLNFNYDV